VIVIDDGSTDGTGAIAAEYAVRLIGTENRGLSSARNTGLVAATGEIVAYLDSDAFPDRDWLWYLAAAFEDSNHAGIGGPNLAPSGGGRIAQCFDNAPGGPVHVLLSDLEAEHIPGCNMAFRRADLLAIGGFDPDLRIAGDDVDVCWRLQARGKTLGFSPSMMVWHHRRTTLRSYWKQQRGYGRAEALLERKWPEKYNVFGHATWSGRIYAGRAAATLGFRAQRVYSGTWCSAPYQSLEQSAPSFFGSLTSTPEWYIVVAALGVLAALGALWPPLLAATPLFVVALSIPLAQATRAAMRTRFGAPALGRRESLRLRGFVAFLYLTQPLARLWGRIEYGLTLWRGAAGWPFAAIKLRREFWSERWRSQQAWLETLEGTLRESGTAPERGGAYDSWDLQLRCGVFGSARLLVAVEEHGAGAQLVRLRMWSVASRAAVDLFALFAVLSALAGLEHAWAACGVLGAFALAIGFRTTQECAAALGHFDRALDWPTGLPSASNGDGFASPVGDAPRNESTE
jgi:GT2 family glycosyltransferase